VATGKPVISFEERPSGSPEAVEKWFYPGDNHGVRFVYPNWQLAHNSQPATTPAPTATTADTTPVPPAIEAMTTPKEAYAQQEEERQILAQEKPVLPTESSPAGLPRTAGNFLILPLVGLALLFVGASMLRLGAVKSE
jgi:hypothetical protein